MDNPPNLPDEVKPLPKEQSLSKGSLLKHGQDIIFVEEHSGKEYNYGFASDICNCALCLSGDE